jgi:hypothetical protein
MSTHNSAVLKTHQAVSQGVGVLESAPIRVGEHLPAANAGSA